MKEIITKFADGSTQIIDWVDKGTSFGDVRAVLSPNA